MHAQKCGLPWNTNAQRANGEHALLFAPTRKLISMPHAFDGIRVAALVLQVHHSDRAKRVRATCQMFSTVVNIVVEVTAMPRDE